MLETRLKFTLTIERHLYVFSSGLGFGIPTCPENLKSRRCKASIAVRVFTEVYHHRPGPGATNSSMNSEGLHVKPVILAPYTSACFKDLKK